MIRLAPLALLLACNGGTIETTDTGEGVDSGETGETGETGPPPCERFEIIGELHVPAAAVTPSSAVTVDIVAIDLSVEDIGTGAVRGAFDVGVISAGDQQAYSLCIDETPVEADLYAPDDTNPTFMAATYVLRAFEDDGEGSATAWVGASFPQIVVYAAGAPPQDWLDIGVTEGWNLLEFDFVNESFTGEALANGGSVDMDAQLLFTPKEGLRASVIPDLSAASAPTAGAYNITSLIDNTVPPPAEATLGGTAVSLATSNANIQLDAFPVPPGDHVHAFTDLPYVAGGFYQVLLWDDTNGTGTYEQGEPPLASSFSATPGRGMAYLEARDWRASIYTLQGIAMGWNLIEGEAFLDWSTGVVLDNTAGR
ncbi:MAG: hypothetical protein EP330_31305 [Deltaproteobacteria bacterium]|nr:MAG: hypothetical protein EP330_31305 [Deltaproteobacteria bacterium]